MITLDIGGTQVKVEDSFMDLNTDQQNATVAKIADSLGIKPPPPPPENSLAGSAKAIGSGAVAGIAGLPADITMLGASGIDLLKGNTNASEAVQGLEPYTSQGITKSLYEPQTGLENTLHNIAGFSAGALIPGGVMRRAANVLVPGTLSEAGGAISNDNPWVKVPLALAGAAGVSKAGTIADAAAARKALPPVQSAEQLKASVSPMFETPALQGARLDNAETTTALQGIRAGLKEKSFDVTPGAPPTQVYNTIKAAEKELGDDYKIQDLHNLRKRLGEIQTSSDKSARTAARYASDYLDEVMTSMANVADKSGGLAPQAVADLRAAMDTAKANFKSQRVQSFIENASLKNLPTHSGANFENYLYQEVAKALAKPDKYLRGWTGTEKEELRKVLPTGWLSFMNRQGYKILGAGGGLGQVVAGFAGSSMLGPLGAALPLAGIGMRKAGEAAALARLNRVGEMVRASTPAYSKHYKDYLKTLERRGLLKDLPPSTQLALQALLASQPKQ